MTKADYKLHRRHFLRGVGGLTLGLPALDVFLPKTANAQTAARPPFLLLVVNGNGVVQGGKDITGGNDPENFWPSKTGAVTTAALEADKATRATGELAAHAARLTFVRGVHHPFPATGCMHASGDAQLLTATTPVGNGNKALASGQSIDTLIAKQLNPAGREPLALHAGKYSPGGTGFDIPGYVSYISAQQPRTYLDSAYKAYQRIVGVVGNGGTTTPPPGQDAAQKLLADRSKSINDLLRAQVQGLLARTDLSASDRRRLDQHFTAIRDIEVRITNTEPAVVTIPEASITKMQTIDPKPYDVAHHFDLVQLHMELMVFSAAADYTRVAVLKIGDREDDHQLTIDGQTFVYHTASHRGVPNGMALCSQIDHMHAQLFKGLLDRLAAIDTPTGKLIDNGVTVWTNQVGNGAHSYQNIPWVLAGSANNYFKTGQFVQVNYQTNRMLNTLLTAVGVPSDAFGATSLAKGIIPEIVASA